MLHNLKKFKIVSWNCRGLGNLEKCDVVRNALRQSRCDVCMIQETKWNDINFNFYSRLLPSFFDRNVVVVHAQNSAGGILIAWNRSYQLLNSWSTRHTCTALLRQTSTGGIFQITNVYGPSTDDGKEAFISELHHISTLVQYPWILGGDFNLVRWMIDRSSNRVNFRLMTLFNDFIRDAALIDVPLQNRRYTWASNRPQPSHSRIDRIFVDPTLSQLFTMVSLKALPNVVSDHAPLLLSCSNEATPRRKFKMELFWMTNPEASEIIRSSWKVGGTNVGQNPLVAFQQNSKHIHLKLRTWHCSKFTDIEQQLYCCNNSVLFLDQIEEHRDLTNFERRFRIMARERAYLLSCIIESRWHHRSRCKWLQVGDKNTRFFHAFASARHRRNRISSITVNDQLLTDESQIREAFKRHMEALLGVDNEVIQFQPEILYPENPVLSTLQDPITDLEIEVAVRQLARQKASGPDGILNEFLQIHWPTIKTDTVQLIQGFFDHSLDLSSINHANITMIPKKEEPKLLGDFRPISVMNAVPKLISKILANRLRSFLPSLISPTQTAFIQGRQITENFNATREILHHISSSGKSACFIKLDFAKAFDSVNWSFLKSIMLARGFPARWIKWIEALLSTASSRIIMNGGETDFFMHRKGLRQGDPLSPMLFNLAADVLQRMINSLNAILNGRISSKLRQSVIMHQYADDTVLIANNSVTALVTLKIMLRLFTAISGLQINFHKSSWIPINQSPDEITTISALLGCSLTEFPVIYLGLPLTINRPTNAAFMPLIERLESKLEGWKSKLISRGGRLLLMNSVLSAVPIYFMGSFLLPKWVIKRIDMIRRSFLWGQSDGKKGISWINWKAVCTPRRYGGMGGADLEKRNWSLLL